MVDTRLRVAGQQHHTAAASDTGHAACTCTGRDLGYGGSGDRLDGHVAHRLDQCTILYVGMVAARHRFGANRTRHAYRGASGRRGDSAGDQRMIGGQHLHRLRRCAAGQCVDLGAVHVGTGAAGNAVDVNGCPDAYSTAANDGRQGRDLLDRCGLYRDPALH